MILLMAAAGCRPPEASPRRAGLTEVYDCPDGLRFVARYERERAWLFLDGDALSAPQVPAGPPLHYATTQVALRGDGRTAALTLRGVQHSGCVLQPGEAEWAAARLRGVHFRAVGSDSGWILEVRERRLVTLTGPPAGDREAAFPHAGIDGADHATYDIDGDGAAWRLTIERAPCDGAGAAVSRAARVRVDVDGHSLSGCGRFLR